MVEKWKIIIQYRMDVFKMIQKKYKGVFRDKNFVFQDNYVLVSRIVLGWS